MLSVLSTIKKKKKKIYIYTTATKEKNRQYLSDSSALCWAKVKSQRETSP